MTRVLNRLVVLALVGWLLLVTATQALTPAGEGRPSCAPTTHRPTPFPTREVRHGEPDR